jgi:hypothetical protein
MSFIFTPTTDFFIASFSETEDLVSRLKCEPIKRNHQFLQHALYCADFLGLQQTICKTIDKLFGINQIIAPVGPGALACQLKSKFRQIVGFRSKLNPLTYVCDYYNQVNLWFLYEDAPKNGMGVNPLCIVPSYQTMLQSNILKEYPHLMIYSVMIWV